MLLPLRRLPVFLRFTLAFFALGSTSALARSDTRILVKFRAGTSARAAERLLSASQARQVSTIGRLNVRVAELPSDRVQSALRSLRQSPVVEYAESDQRLAPQELLPNDSSFPAQFAVSGGAWGWYQTHTTQAWDITRGDPSVIVAILDTGLKTQGLADYDGQVVSGWNVMKNSSDTASAAGNHGTCVAGVVGLALNNGIGNAGYCPGCKVMPVQVGTDSGAYLSDIASGITWATDHGARVENMSWAGTSSSTTLTNAVAYARGKGVVLTAAAGNSNCDCVTYPAATTGVIGVAGTTNNEAKQGDSNFGSWVKVAAPEGNMTSWPSINSGPGYAPVGGTSLAAPVVAGVAGLLFSAGPSLTGGDVEQALKAPAAPVNFAVQYGRVDALAAMRYVGIDDPQTAATPSNTVAPQILVETNGNYNAVPLSASPQPGQVLLRGQGAWSGSAPLRLASVQWERCSGTACTVVGSSNTYTVQAADAGYNLRLAISVQNGLGVTTASSAVSSPVGGTAISSPAQNTAPPAVSGTAQDGQTLTASAGTWSGSPTAYAYQWQRCDSSGATCSAIAGATDSSYVAASADVGWALRVTVTATNAVGSSAAQSAATNPVAATPSGSPTTSTTTFSGS
jgi:subtilisin family serine protease